MGAVVRCGRFGRLAKPRVKHGATGPECQKRINRRPGLDPGLGLFSPCAPTIAKPRVKHGATSGAYELGCCCLKQENVSDAKPVTFARKLCPRVPCRQALLKAQAPATAIDLFQSTHESQTALRARRASRLCCDGDRGTGRSPRLPLNIIGILRRLPHPVQPDLLEDLLVLGPVLQLLDVEIQVHRHA